MSRFQGQIVDENDGVVNDAQGQIFINAPSGQRPGTWDGVFSVPAGADLSNGAYRIIFETGEVARIVITRLRIGPEGVEGGVFDGNGPPPCAHINRRPSKVSN